MSGEFAGAPNQRRVAERAVRDSPKPATPYTPTSRFISSTYSSPGSTYGKEEDAVILELNQRFIRAGIEGESCPQCRIDFCPSNARRTGDFRTVIPGFQRTREDLENWGDGYELWRTDLRDVDLGLVSDRLERAIREIYNKHLLVDAGSARLVLILPSVLAHPTLSTILQTLLERWNYSTITLIPAPAMAVVGAGLRSGLVVDIGWEETTISSIYEYREVNCVRSTRAMKMLTKIFAEYAREQMQQQGASSDFRFDLEIVEDILCRLRPILALTTEDGKDDTVETVSVEWPTEVFSQSLTLNKKSLITLVSKTLLAQDEDEFYDDQETPLNHLMYRSLRDLPPDVRSICMGRIMFVGSGAEIPMVPDLCLKKFSSLLSAQGWNRTVGSKVSASLKDLGQLSWTRSTPSDAIFNQEPLSEKLLVEERFLRDKAKSATKDLQGTIGHVETLGVWAGASLMTSLKVKSFVEIQRDRFLSHGLSGSTRSSEISVIPQQRTSGVPIRNKTSSEKNGWTLAGWA